MNRLAGTPFSRQFTDADLERIPKSTFVERVEFHSAIESTNSRGLELAAGPPLNGPLLILAETQTNGRGRGLNRWWADTGALTFTLLLKTHLPPRRLPQASLTVGLAVCEAIEDVSKEPNVQLKWPNDVYARQRKLGGILIELPASGAGMMAIGIGINVNNSLRNAPEELRSSAVALCDISGQEISLSRLLERVLVQLDFRLNCIGQDDGELLASWRERCLLTDRTIEMEIGKRRINGLCRGINQEGALVIDTEQGTEVCFAGSVTQF